MRRDFFAALLVFLFLNAPHAGAQDAELSATELNESGEAYLKAIAGRRISSDVSYYDPTAAAPELETQEEPDPVRDTADRDLSGPVLDWPFGLIAGIIIAIIIFFFARFGGNVMVILQPTSDNPSARRRQASSTRSRAAMATPRNLAEITGMKDRRAALILLTQNALRNAVTANGLLLRDSWTDREALRRLPKDQRHLDALRDLVRACERVQFGDRDVSEPEFTHYVTRITPLFRELAT